MSSSKANQVGSELPILQPVENGPAAPRRKSRRGPIRACVLICVQLLIVAHITQFVVQRRSLSPVEPSEAMYTIELGYLNAGAIFFAIAVISTAIFGRFFCGWGCHIIALQDLCSYVLRRIGIRPKPFRSRLLVCVPFVAAFYMFFWPTVQRLWLGVPHPGFTNHLLTENFWRTFPGPFITVLTFVVCGGGIVYLLGNKGFCTYACPYGAFFSVSDRLAVGRIRVTDACQHCGQCTAACTSNVRVHSEVKDFGMVVDPGCMKCMDCVSVCPNDALYFGLSNKAPASNSRDALPVAGKPPRQRKSYDFSVPEELFGLLIAACSVFAFRGLYDGPPLLLSMALGVITAYLALQFGRIFRVRDMRIQNIRLKATGRITNSGRWAIVVLCAWFAFNIHSFFVQYNRYQGRRHLNRITATWPDLLGGKPPSSFTPDDRAKIDAARRNFQTSDRLGLIGVLDVKLGLALTNMMSGDMQAAEKYLRQAYDCQPSAVREMLMEFLVSQGRQKEAEALL